MEIDRRATPCVGICSTTYGDLVCRGCKRFAHEIVAWNSYRHEQHDRIWQRLGDLRDASTAMFVEVTDPSGLARACRSLRPAIAGSDLSCAYEILRRRGRWIDRLESVGLSARDRGVAEPVAVREAIDGEFLRRSIAAYEHSFHVTVDE